MIDSFTVVTNHGIGVVLENPVWNFAKETTNSTLLVFTARSALLPQNISGDWMSRTSRPASVQVQDERSK